ncbi:MAG: response regulator transcription factor [Candidatus Cloacimonetes bacterium]|nr:response regulator transcription factor [Candidatus Cloacimonadota bacterium]
MKHKILILEDNTDLRHILIEFFSENGIKALGAETTKEAMSIYNENNSEIKLFIIDLWLPDGNGMDFLKTVRKKSNTSPAIIMSSVITEDVRRIGKQLGVVAYFEKPFDLYALREKVKGAIGPN